MGRRKQKQTNPADENAGNMGLMGEDALGSTNSSSTDDESVSLDGVLGELQEVVNRLEQSELPLEEALRAFERGVSLSRRGQHMLDQAEQKVELLMRDGSTRPLDGAPLGESA